MSQGKQAVGVHTMHVMDSSGDTEISWRESDPDSFTEAKKVFDDIKRRGGAVFREQPNGEGGGKLTEFDPSADMIAVPAIQGG